MSGLSIIKPCPSTIWWLKSRQIWCLLLRLGWGRALMLPLKKFVLLSFRSCTNLDARAEERDVLILFLVKVAVPEVAGYDCLCVQLGLLMCWLLYCLLCDLLLSSWTWSVTTICWYWGPQSPVEYRSSWPPWKPEGLSKVITVLMHVSSEIFHFQTVAMWWGGGGYYHLPLSWQFDTPILESWTLLDGLPHMHLDLCFQASAWGCSYG